MAVQRGPHIRAEQASQELDINSIPLLPMVAEPLISASSKYPSAARTMPELEVGLAVAAWSIDTDTGDDRGSGNPGTTAAAAGPTVGTVASLSSGALPAISLAAPGVGGEAPAATGVTDQLTLCQDESFCQG